VLRLLLRMVVRVRLALTLTAPRRLILVCNCLLLSSPLLFFACLLLQLFLVFEEEPLFNKYLLVLVVTALKHVVLSELL
jgi:hypothetical protein